MAFWVPRIPWQTGREEPAPSLEKPNMFENVIDPSAEGRWTRVAPYLTMATIVAVFWMALMVVVSAVQTGHYLTTRVPKEAPAVARPAIVQNALELPSGG